MNGLRGLDRLVRPDRLRRSAAARGLDVERRLADATERRMAADRRFEVERRRTDAPDRRLLVERRLAEGSERRDAIERRLSGAVDRRLAVQRRVADHLSAAGGRRSERGQSTVEYALIVPALLLILLGILEFGFAFSHHISMEYATREGARTGAALNNGTTQFACADVDDQIIAALQRVLTAAGSQVNIAKIGQVRIYKADSAGKEAGPVEVWKPGAGNKVDGVALKFVRVSGDWNACSRQDAGFGKTDSLGVSLSYDYQYVTPLGNLMGLGGNPTLHMADRTVMALNPD